MVCPSPLVNFGNLVISVCLSLNSYHDVLPHLGPDFELRLYVILVGKMQKVQICYNLQLLYLHEMQMIICMKNLHKIFEIL